MIPNPPIGQKFVQIEINNRRKEMMGLEKNGNINRKSVVLHPAKKIHGQKFS